MAEGNHPSPLRRSFLKPLCDGTRATLSSTAWSMDVPVALSITQSCHAGTPTFGGRARAASPHGSTHCVGSRRTLSDRRVVDENRALKAPTQPPETLPVRAASLTPRAGLQTSQRVNSGSMSPAMNVCSSADHRTLAKPTLVRPQETPVASGNSSPMPRTGTQGVYCPTRRLEARSSARTAGAWLHLRGVPARHRGTYRDLPPAGARHLSGDSIGASRQRIECVERVTVCHA
jgi:hypothetical protein